MHLTHDGPPTPPPAALQWAADAVGPGATVRAVCPLPGATSSTLHRIELESRGRSLEVVLRQFTNAEWLADEPDLARHEAASLELARQADVPTPELIAFDEDGGHCGAPAVLMTRLPGAVELKPPCLDRWLDQLAEAALAIHALAAPGHPWEYFTYNDVHALELPRWSRAPEAWERALEIVRGPRPATRQCFIHRDYHPTNVLWEEGRVSGVVDWVNACRGSPAFDVAHCRLNLAYLHGARMADRFLAAYERLAGEASEHQRYWDLMALIEFLPGPPESYEGWVTFGLKSPGAEVLIERADEYVTSLLARPGD